MLLNRFAFVSSVYSGIFFFQYLEGSIFSFLYIYNKCVNVLKCHKTVSRPFVLYTQLSSFVQYLEGSIFSFLYIYNKCVNVLKCHKTVSRPFVLYTQLSSFFNT